MFLSLLKQFFLIAKLGFFQRLVREEQILLALGVSRFKLRSILRVGLL